MAGVQSFTPSSTPPHVVNVIGPSHVHPAVDMDILKETSSRQGQSVVFTGIFSSSTRLIPQHLSHNVKASCAATSAIPACTLAEVTRARRVSFASELKTSIERITMRFDYFPRRRTHTQHASSSRLAIERISFHNE